VGEAWDGERAVELARSLQPDVVLLDVRMPRRDGVSAVPDIVAYSRVLMMTYTQEPDVIRQAVAAGASGYVVHGSFDAEDLVATVRSVARGVGVFTGEAMDALRAGPQPAAAEQTARGRGDDLGLSERQAEIMALVGAGLTNGEIARTCFLAEKTVKNHINHIFAVLGARSRGEAIALWLGTRPEPAANGPAYGSAGPSAR
jgi:DNA-binding NarL/FixJ family response regulator